MTIAQRLSDLRESLGVSQSAMAKKLGVSQSYLSEVLAGRGKPSLEMVVGVARNFPEVSLAWLLTGAGPMRREEPLPAPEPPVEAGPGVEEVLAVVLEVERLFQERDYHLPPEKKVRLIRLILESLVRREREAAEERERWLALTREWVLDRRGLLQMLEIVSS